MAGVSGQLVVKAADHLMVTVTKQLKQMMLLFGSKVEKLQTWLLNQNLN